MAAAFCFLGGGRIRSGNQVLLGGTQTLLQNTDLRGASQVAAASSWLVRGDRGDGSGRQVEEWMLPWLVSSFSEPLEEGFY